MAEPWKRPFRNIGAGTKTAFDDVAKQLLDINNASQGLAESVSTSIARKGFSNSLSEKLPRKRWGL